MKFLLFILKEEKKQKVLTLTDSFHYVSQSIYTKKMVVSSQNSKQRNLQSCTGGKMEFISCTKHSQRFSNNISVDWIKENLSGVSQSICSTRAALTKQAQNASSTCTVTFKLSTKARPPATPLSGLQTKLTSDNNRPRRNRASSSINMPLISSKSGSIYTSRGV